MPQRKSKKRSKKRSPKRSFRRTYRDTTDTPDEIKKEALDILEEIRVNTEEIWLKKRIRDFLQENQNKDPELFHFLVLDKLDDLAYKKEYSDFVDKALKDKAKELLRIR